MKIRRILSAVILSVLLSALLPAPRAYALEDPDVQAKAALLIDFDSGLVLYEKNARSAQYPASITKVMVALLVLEAVERGELRMDQPITASASALSDLTADSSTADIRVGEALTVEQLLYCMLVVSANETGNILAEAVDGNKAAFVERMNRRAAELGCENTHFANTSGLHNADHYSSARDIYLFTREAMKHEAFLTICGSKSYTVPATEFSPERELHSTNGLISNWRYLGYLYDGAFGIKTGTTEQAGKCLVAGAKRGDRTLISVVLGAGVSEDDRNMSFTETSRLFDWGFNSFAPMTVLRAEQLYPVSVTLSKETDTVMAHPESDTPESVAAPITAGDVLGQITVSYNGHDYATVPLLAISDVSASHFLVGKDAVKTFFSLTYVKIGLMVLLIAIVLFFFWWHTVRPRRRYGRGQRRSRVGSYRGRRR